MNCSTPGLLVHHQLLESTQPMSIESVIPSNHLILCRPLLLLPSIFPSIRIFLNESALCIRWPKYWSFSFNISPFNEHPGLIFRMDWLEGNAKECSNYCTIALIPHAAAATAAKSLQSCLTLCDPIDGSPPRCPVPGILQARTLEWVAISFFNA